MHHPKFLTFQAILLREELLVSLKWNWFENKVAFLKSSCLVLTWEIIKQKHFPGLLKVFVNKTKTIGNLYQTLVCLCVQCFACVAFFHLHGPVKEMLPRFMEEEGRPPPQRHPGECSAPCRARAQAPGLGSSTVSLLPFILQWGRLPVPRALCAWKHQGPYLTVIFLISFISSYLSIVTPKPNYFIFRAVTCILTSGWKSLSPFSFVSTHNFLHSST